MSIFSRILIGGVLRPFMKPIPGDVAHKKLRPLVYAYVGLAFILFNISMYISEKSKNGEEVKETQGEWSVNLDSIINFNLEPAEYINRVFKVQNPTIYKISWSKGIEKEQVETSKFYTLPDDGESEPEENTVLTK